MVIVDEPEPGAAMELGLKLTVVPEGCPEAESATAELKPPETVVVMVEVPELPCTIDFEVGFAEIAKSGVCVPPQVENLKVPMRVFQLNVPEVFMYSCVYQKVQSSTGSTCMAL